MKKLLAGFIAAGIMSSFVTVYADENSDSNQIRTESNIISDYLTAKYALKTIDLWADPEKITNHLFGVDSNEDLDLSFAYDLNKDSEVNITDLIISKNYKNALSKYPNISVSDLNLAAKHLSESIINTITDYDNKGLSFPSGIITSEQDDPFTESINTFYSGYNFPEINWMTSLSEYGEIEGVIVCAPSNSNISGTYPNEIPINYNIPFSEESLLYSQDPKQFTDIENYRIDDEICIQNEGLNETDKEEIYNFDNLVAEHKQTLCNLWAKNILTAVYESITDFDNHGWEYDNGIVSSEDDSDLSRSIRNLACSVPKELSWYTEIDQTGLPQKAVVVFEDKVTAYPDNKADTEISEEESEIIETFLKINKEKNENSLLIESAEMMLTHITPYSIHHTFEYRTVTSKARELYSCVSELLLSYSNKGIELPSGYFTSDDNSDFVKHIKELMPADRSLSYWSVYIEDDAVKAVYNTKYSKGIYPDNND